MKHEVSLSGGHPAYFIEAYGETKSAMRGFIF